MTFITTLFQKTLIMNCYLLTQTVLWNEIKSVDVYEKLFTHKYLFPLSSCPKDWNFFDETNKKVIGKMKDESGGNIINEFVGLKSQMYSMKNIDDKDSNIAKGVNIATEFNKFKDIIFNNKVLRHKMRRIQGKNINLENT